MLNTIENVEAPEKESSIAEKPKNPLGFDFESLMVPDTEDIQVSPVLATIAVGKPAKTDFIWVRSGPGWEPLKMFVYESERVPYLVAPECQQLCFEKEVLVVARFYMYQIYGSGILKLDYVNTKLDKFGEMNKYNATRMEAYRVATTQWLQLRANNAGGFYSYALAEDTLPEPTWSNKPESLRAAIEIAFKGFVIDSLNHPLMKRIRGKL